MVDMRKGQLERLAGRTASSSSGTVPGTSRRRERSWKMELAMERRMREALRYRHLSEGSSP